MILSRTFGRQIFVVHGALPEPSVSLGSSVLTAIASGSDYDTRALDRRHLTGPFGRRHTDLTLETLTPTCLFPWCPYYYIRDLLYWLCASLKQPVIAFGYGISTD